MAQLVEHILGKDEVPSSNLASSSKKASPYWVTLFWLYSRFELRVCKANPGSHTPLEARRACSSGAERGYLRHRRIPVVAQSPDWVTLFWLYSRFELRVCIANPGSHTPLEARRACSSGAERGYLRHRRIPVVA